MWVMVKLGDFYSVDEVWVRVYFENGIILMGLVAGGYEWNGD